MYKVGRQTPESGEREIAAFLHLTDARRFIASCLAEEEYNRDYGKQYHLYDVNGNRCESHAIKREDNDPGYESHYSPTPCPTVPHPKGVLPMTRRRNPDDEE